MNELTSKFKSRIITAVALFLDQGLDRKIFDILGEVRFDFDNYDQVGKIDIIYDNIIAINRVAKIVDTKLRDSTLTIESRLFIREGIESLDEARELLIQEEFKEGVRDSKRTGYKKRRKLK